MIENILKQDNYIVEKFNKTLFIEREIYSSFDSDSKLVWTVWLRWVGKTSYLLSRRAKKPKSIYISCDSLNLKNESLFNLLDELRKNFSYDTFFLDEIHYFANWQQELKNIYDFLDVKIVFSGSNMINLTKWGYDLSRRALKYELREFSFAEYIKITKFIEVKTYSLQEILNNHIDIAKENISWYSRLLLENYLDVWQFWYNLENIWNETEYKMKLENSIKKSIFEDLSEFVDISTTNLSKIEDIVFYLANSGTSEISIHAISKKVNLSPQTIEIYLNFLSSIWLIYILDFYWNLGDKLRKSKKFYLSNTNILNLFSQNVWNIRETFFVSQIKRINKEIGYMTSTDFAVNYENKNLFFEIWWKNKKRDEKNIFIIKDDIQIWVWNNIPLWLFWLLK